MGIIQVPQDFLDEVPFSNHLHLIYNQVWEILDKEITILMVSLIIKAKSHLELNLNKGLPPNQK